MDAAAGRREFTGPARVAVIVPAAGGGGRLGGPVAKALRDLAGLPMLLHAVRAMAAARSVDLVVVAAAAAVRDRVADLLGRAVPEVRCEVVAGGASRAESVQRGLAVLPGDVDVVLVHDAARPLAPASLAEQVVEAVRSGRDAVVPVVPVADTVRRVDRDGRVLATIPRDDLYTVQTPQGFRRALLLQAYASRAASGAPPQVTDDAGLVEWLGCPIWTVPGSAEAFKVTRPADLVLAEAVLAARGAR